MTPTSPDTNQPNAAKGATAEAPRKNPRALALIALHVLLLVYSLSGFFSKNASRQEFLSLPFFAFYFGMLCVLGIYAIGWQQILKRLPLTLAFANKGITVVWGIVWGFVFFHEAVTVPKIAGAMLILAGIALFSYADAEAAQRPVQEPAGSGREPAYDGEAATTQAQGQAGGADE